LRYLREKVLPEELKEKKRIWKRAKKYRFKDDTVLERIMGDGSTRIVPAPQDRARIISECHEKCGHFGQRRTRHLLQHQYWWSGMSIDVAYVIRCCIICDRVQQSFSAPTATLHSLPICGMFYRWGVDLLKLPESKAGYTRVMVAVEHFSKNIEIVPLKDKNAETVADAFALHVLGRFGACAEVLTDQGTEFKGPFQSQLEDCLIDHRFTTPNHPQSNGLAERAVQTVKKALRKMCDSPGVAERWEKAIPWIGLGYRCSAQASSGFHPMR
jgi:Integrase zinc binding domain